MGRSKRKKDINSPDSQTIVPEQKRQTMASGNSQQNNGQQQAQASPLFQTFSQSMPTMSYSQPYYSSPPPPPMPGTGVGMPGQPGALQDVWVRILDRLDTMDRKLTQLDSIQVSVNKITDQVYTMNTKINSLEAKMANVEQSREFDSKSIDLLQEKQNKIDSILEKMQKLEADQKEKLLDIQSREMRDNLIFYKIPEQRDETAQDCEDKVRNLIEREMNVSSAREIRFHRVHRIGRFNRNKTRPIVAKFAFYPDRETVRKAAKNLEGTNFSVGQQFPKEIMERRKRLVPIMKQAKSAGKDAYISFDKLYINGVLYKDNVDANTEAMDTGSAGSTAGQPRGQGQSRT